MSYEPQYRISRSPALGRLRSRSNWRPSQPNPTPEAKANAWLLLALRKDLDSSGDGQLSFEEAQQNRTSGNISAEHQAQLASIDQAAFDALEKSDGTTNSQVDLHVLAGNKYLIKQITQHGSPLPSDFLLASLAASGQIADPQALSADEQKLGKMGWPRAYLSPKR